MGKMSSGMRMMAMARAGQQRDGRGRYMEGGQMTMMDPPEMRRQRDSRGRYMEGTSMGYHIPPYLEENDMRRMGEEPDGQNPYGGQPEVYRKQEPKAYMPHMTDGKTSAGEIDYARPDGGYGNVRYFTHRTDPLNQREGSQRQIGFQSKEQKPLDKETVTRWVEEMEDGEGVRGGKYTWHQAQQYAMNMGITGQQRLMEFYWAMNAMYADYHQVAKKFGIDKQDFYACMAKAFIEDADAVDNKVEEYVKHIVKHDK